MLVNLINRLKAHNFYAHETHIENKLEYDYEECSILAAILVSLS